MAACTGDRPGVTKLLQLDKGITLLDSPGVGVESAADGVSSEPRATAVVTLLPLLVQSTNTDTPEELRNCAPVPLDEI